MTGITCALAGGFSAGGGAAFQSGVTSLTNASWNYITYTAPQISYVGADSSGNPIWLWGFKDSSNSYSKCMLIRVNSNGSVSQSSVTTLEASANPKYDVSVTTEYPNASQGWAFYSASDTYFYAKTFSIDKDALSIGTPGSALKVFPTIGQVSFTHAAYAGNNRAFVTTRDDGSGGNGVTFFSRSTNTITKVGNMSDLGDQSVFHSMIGFDYSSASSGLYRWAGQTYGPNLQVGYYNGSSASSVYNFNATEFLTGFSYTNGNPMVNVNGSNKFVMFGKSGTNGLVARAGTITWPTSGTAAPTMSSGTQISLTDAANGGLWAPAKSYTSDECYFVYKNNSNSNWYYRKLTLSSNTITEGSATQITNTPSSATGFIHSMAGTASTSTGNWLVFLTDNSGSANPDFTVVKLT